MSPMPIFHFAFFDLDGTLVLASDAILGCWAQFAESERLPTASDLQEAIFGQPLVDFLKKYYPCPEDRQDAVARFEKLYLRSWLRKVAPVPGAQRGLQHLRRAGISVAVVSANQHNVVERTLAATGMLDFVDCYSGVDLSRPSPRNKAHLIAEQMRHLGAALRSSILIGDTRSDLEAAVEVGIPFWAVSYGHGDASELLRLGASRKFGTFEEVVAAVVSSD